MMPWNRLLFLWSWAVTTAGLLSAMGCQSLVGERSSLPPDVVLENPLFLPQGQDSYQQVFHDVRRAVESFFPIAASNIYAGSIDSAPVITAGFWDGLRYGWYDRYELCESSLQTIRRRAVVRIIPAEVGGYFVDVRVYKELEDLPKPAHATAGAAVIRQELPMDPSLQPVLPQLSRAGWILIGRDPALEQKILRRLRCLR